jgi:hypothetical protein
MKSMKTGHTVVTDVATQIEETKMQIPHWGDRRKAKKMELQPLHQETKIVNWFFWKPTHIDNKWVWLETREVQMQVKNVGYSYEPHYKWVLTAVIARPKGGSTAGPR